MLVGGDLNAADETDLAAHVQSLTADVLVVPHNGATQAGAFLEAVHPRIAVVSVGRGNAQHDPSAAALQTLSKVAGRVSRTDLHGDVAITADGSQLTAASRS